MRNRGYAGDPVVLGREGHPPYELPALSKEMLLGDADSPHLVHEPDFYADHRVELRSGVEVVRIDVGERVIVDSTGVTHGYDRLILATGSTPRRLPAPVTRAGR